MSPSQSSLLVLLLMVSCSWATHFSGGTMTFNPRGTNPDGTYRVDLRYKTAIHLSINFPGCFSGTWWCVSGDCGNETSLVVNTVDMGISEDWCQVEGVMTRHVSSNTQTFDLQLDSCCWIDNDNSVFSWRLLTHVDLGVRSDTGTVNRSPQTTVIPLMRVPANCQRDFNLLLFDPDGDQVRCRYAVPTDECYTSSDLPNDFTLRENCTLSFWGNSNTTGTYAVQMVMEDFPTQSISLSYTDGYQSNRTSNDTLCKLPVQFAVRVDPPVTSCMEGLYLPMFLSPTPAQGALLNASADQPLEITVRAQATNSTVSELLVSGPSGITENTIVSGEYLLRWTPTEDEEGGYYPVCFIAQGVNDSSKYHSELRCVIVRVGNTSAIITTEPTTSPPLTINLTTAEEPTTSPPLTINLTTTEEPTTSPPLTINLTTTEEPTTSPPLTINLTTTEEPTTSPPLTINLTTTQIAPELPTTPTNFSTYATTASPTLSTNPTTDLTTHIVDSTTKSSGPRYVVVLRIKVSSLIPLTDDYIRNVVFQQLRVELIRLGLPGDFMLRLLATHDISP
ncbi:mucin-5AC isoform X2 [Salmo trutta]|uniref:mucin-5AC isoform X2 n=1 Tax=Salmo trutta TaxID=8032 RepID=UPI00112FDD6F|nr:mucin-5AC-like isoform X2 [Salmo trutta]